MPTLAILPAKSFRDAKQRLGHQLEPGPRKLLAEAMFTDVLVALRRARSIDRVVVVSTDHHAQQIAGAYGATLLQDDDRGHSEAAAYGIRHAIEHGFERVLLIPGDCPALAPRELDELLARPAEPPSAIIVPDRHETGTNALVLTPPDALPPAFGPGSCERHVSDALSAGVHCEIVHVPGLALDVDTPDDLEQLRATLTGTHGGAAHTRGLLRRLFRRSVGPIPE